MDAADLKVFEAVARLGGMNRAAGELHTVQSNVTTRIRHLEEDLGAPLFERHSRGVTLTGAGRRLLPYAKRIAHVFRDARRVVQDEGTPRGELTVGSLETTVALHLSPILARYAADFPEVDLILRTGTTAELIDSVLAYQLEGAFVCGPLQHRDLETEVVFQEELVVATAPGVAKLSEIGAQADLKIVVLRAGCSYRQRLEQALARRGIVGLRQLEFGTVEAIVGCVAGGLGVTLMPRGIMAPAAHQGQVALHALPAGEAWVDTLFIRHRQMYASSALSAFLASARAAE